jgi:hypothetical protein
MTTIKNDTKLTGITNNTTYATKHGGKDSEAFSQTITFDFSDMTLQEVLDLATGALIVRRQAVLRKMPTEAAMIEHIRATDKTTISAKDAGKSPNGRAMSPDQIAAKLEEMPMEERIAYIKTHMPAMAAALGLDK